MIKKVLSCFIWFLVIFIVSYVIIGAIVILFAAGAETNQAKYEAARAFRNNFMIIFLIGSFILSIIGTIIGVLPGTERRDRKKVKK